MIRAPRNPKNNSDTAHTAHTALHFLSGTRFRADFLHAKGGDEHIPCQVTKKVAVGTSRDLSVDAMLGVVEKVSSEIRQGACFTLGVTWYQVHGMIHSIATSCLAQTHAPRQSKTYSKQDNGHCTPRDHHLKDHQ